MYVYYKNSLRDIGTILYYWYWNNTIVHFRETINSFIFIIMQPEERFERLLLLGYLL